MYSRPPNRDIRIPHNYSGSIFDRNASTPVQDLTRRRPSSQPPHFVDTPNEPPEQVTEQNIHDDIIDIPDSDSTPSSDEQNTSTDKKSTSTLLSPIGSLGTEEILLIALALIIFQNGKDPDLALILLALLFM